MNGEPSMTSPMDPVALSAPYAQRLKCLQLAITSARSSKDVGEAFQCLAGYTMALEDAQIINPEQGTQLNTQGRLLHIDALERLQSQRTPHWAALIIRLNS